MNIVNLIGRLTADPELMETQGGKHYCKFTLAVDRASKGEKQTDFIRCIAWDETAKTMKTYLVKGSKIAVIGNIKTGSYDDKGGKKVYTTDVWVDRFEFCESRVEVATSDTKSNSKIDDVKKKAKEENIDIEGFEIIGDEILPF